jgi:hypothetical protein
MYCSTITLEREFIDLAVRYIETAENPGAGYFLPGA